MKRLAFVVTALLAGCGYNETYMTEKFRAMSDADLLRAHAAATMPLSSALNPQYKWTTAEMKRRGLLGPGKDGKPVD